MAEMEKLKERPEEVAKVADRVRKADRRSGLAGKTFESMTNPQKDKLLKALAVRAGLIDDSDD